MVSIVIPCYNDVNYIEEAVNSALKQTYFKKEIIVVDDGSDIETRRVLSRLEPKLDLLITQKNKGLSAARNVGIENSKGDFILVLDSDDFFDQSFCEKALRIITEEKAVKIVTCHANRFDENGIIDIFKPRGGKIENFLFSNSAIGNSFYAKEDWQIAGGYDEKMKEGYEDWEFYIRLLKIGGRAYVIKEPLFNYRQKKNSMRKDANAIKYELWKYIYLKHSELYKKHYHNLILHFMNQLQLEANTKLKREQSIDYMLGAFILKPVRFLKRKVLRN